jgi:hypothetical protein
MEEILVPKEQLTFTERNKIWTIILQKVEQLTSKIGTKNLNP